MKKLLTLSFLLTKLTALYCFSAMGFVAWDFVEAKSPCHQDSEQISQAKEPGKEDCNACIIAVDSWDQELVEASDITLSTAVAVPSSFIENITKQKSLLTGVYEQYYPPPQVLFKTAFHLPKLVTVILV